MSEINEKPKPKTSFGKRLLKRTFYLLLILIIASGIGLLILNNYLQSNTTKVLDQLSFLDRGIITFDEAEFSVWQNFPSVSLDLHQVVLKDTSLQSNQQPIFLEKITAAASLAELLNKSIEIKYIHIKGGTVQILTDSLGNSNLKHLFQQKKAPPPNTNTEKKEQKFEAKFNQLKIHLEEIVLHLTNATKGTSIHGTIQSITTDLDLKDNKNLNAQVSLDVAMKELAFKKKNGGFVANSQLQGTLEVQMQNGNITIPPFDLLINEETFQASADLFFDGKNVSVLNFKNEAANYDKVVPLLTEKIQKVLLPYHVERPFSAGASIQTHFKPGENPVVFVDFEMKDNDVKAFGIPLDKTSLKGQFINRLYDDERKLSEPKGNVSLFFHDVKGHHNSFLLETDSLGIRSTKAGGPNLHSIIEINGMAKDMGEWLENDQFFFEDGTFQLHAHVNGALKNINDIIIQSEAKLLLSDFSVFYQPANVAFPFKKLELKKKIGDSFFSLSNELFGEDKRIYLDGGLKNLPALLVELSGEQASSEVHIKTKKLSWKDFIDLFSNNSNTKKEKTKTDKEAKKSLKSTLLGIQHNFQPRMTIAVDTLQYTDDIQLFNFHTGVHFENEHTLILEKTEFTFDGSHIDLSGKIDLRNEQRTPVELEFQGSKINLQTLLPKFNFFNVQLLADIEEHPDDVTILIKHKLIIDDHEGPVSNSATGSISIISNNNKQGKIEANYVSNYREGMPNDSVTMNTQISIEGNPKNFNDFFKTENFHFEDGKFKVNFDYDGNLHSIPSLIENSIVNFSITNSGVFFKPANTTFPLTKIELTAHEKSR